MSDDLDIAIRACRECRRLGTCPAHRRASDDRLAVLNAEQRAIYDRLLGMADKIGEDRSRPPEHTTPHIAAAELLRLATENRKLRLQVEDMRSYLEDDPDDHAD